MLKFALLDFLSIPNFYIFYGKIFIVVSKSALIIGREIEIIKIFPPISTFEAIEVSFASLHTLTANSVSIAIPVILIRIFIYSVFIFPFKERLSIKLNIPMNLSKRSVIIRTPATIEN